MKKSICLLLTLSVILVLVSVGMAAAKKPAPSLRCTTEYVFVGHLQEIPDDLEEGRLLVWEGPISGDIEGVIAAHHKQLKRKVTFTTFPDDLEECDPVDVIDIPEQEEKHEVFYLNDAKREE
jgi:hypothetical protein